MPIAHPQSDSEFNILLANVGTTPLIVDFFASWCSPCRNIAPLFEELSNTYPNLKFVKVDFDKLTDTSSKFQVSALPTFVVFLNGQKMDELSGANPETLRSLVQKWAQNCPTQLESPVFGQIPLLCFVDRAQSECLNEHDKHPFSVFLNNEGDLISDVDEQLIINYRFTQPVNIHSICISGKENNGPKIVKFFVNNLNTLDFERAQSSKPVQVLDFSDGEDLKQLYYVKFQNLNSLQLFVENNKSGTDQTIIKKIDLYGTPLNSTNMEEFKRIAGKPGEAGH